jgi:hypothetical protein
LAIVGAKVNSWTGHYSLHSGCGERGRNPIEEYIKTLPSLARKA